jgi:hypothetical protein
MLAKLEQNFSKPGALRKKYDIRRTWPSAKMYEANIFSEGWWRKPHRLMQYTVPSTVQYVAKERFRAQNQRMIQLL